MKKLRLNSVRVAGWVLYMAVVVSQPVVAGQDQDLESASFGVEASISDQDLASQSGQGASASHTATVSHNTITVNGGGTLVNGNNIMGDRALANVSGLTSVIQNSGNNVVIQDSTVISVSFQ